MSPPIPLRLIIYDLTREVVQTDHLWYTDQVIFRCRGFFPCAERVSLDSRVLTGRAVVGSENSSISLTRNQLPLASGPGGLQGNHEPNEENVTAAAGGRDLSGKRKNRAIMGLLVGVAAYIVLVLTSPMLSSLWPLSSSYKPRASTVATENAEDESTLITSTNLRRGQTIYEILVSAGITYEKTNGLIREFETLFNPRKA